MTTEKVNDLEIVSLLSFFDPKKFRLIPADAHLFSGGISEIPVHINLHSGFAKQLDFDTRNLQKLYGFGIICREMILVNQGEYYSPERGGKIRLVELNDCGELWIMKFDFFDASSKLYAVERNVVKNLLNQARKPAFLDYTVF